MYLIILFEPEINSYFVIFFVHIEYHCNSHIPQPSNNKDIGIMIPNTVGTDVIFEHIFPASPEIPGSSLCTLFPSHREPTTLQEHRRLVFLETSCNLHRLEDLFGQECWLSFCLKWTVQHVRFVLLGKLGYLFNENSSLLWVLHF